MWDALGVLALKAYAGFLRARGNAVQVLRSGPVPHPAGYAMGSAFVPVEGVELHRPGIGVRERLHRLVALLRGTVHAVRDRRARARFAREALARAQPEERALVRIPVNERRRPLPGSLLRLGVTLAIGSVAVSAVAVFLGMLAARAIDALLG